MKMQNPLEESPRYKECSGTTICSMIGGSRLYGLSTPSSDIDYRGVFFAKDPLFLSGIKNIDSISLTDEGVVDGIYFSLLRFLQLLRKTNTQSMEILFAPQTSFIVRTPLFEEIYKNRYSLIDSDVLKLSLKGYIFSELRLATGQRSGQLGGKRKEAVRNFGFSPKNFVQLFRLVEVGKNFFLTGNYMIDVKDHSPELHKFLIDLKTNPAKFTCEWLQEELDGHIEELDSVMTTSGISFKFDERVASEIMLKAIFES